MASRHQWSNRSLELHCCKWRPPTQRRSPFGIPNTTGFWNLNDFWVQIIIVDVWVQLQKVKRNFLASANNKSGCRRRRSHYRKIHVLGWIKPDHIASCFSLWPCYFSCVLLLLPLGVWMTHVTSSYLGRCTLTARKRLIPLLLANRNLLVPKF